MSFVRGLGPETVYLAHLNDNDLKSDQHLAVGAGRIDYRAFMRAYLREAWTFPLLLETQTAEQALSCKVYLEDLVKEIAKRR